jgi:hypothetical protein
MHSRLRSLIVLLSLSTAMSCVTQYQPVGFGGGFSETQLDEHAFRVTFKGNGYTKHERTEDFVWLRAAELCMQHGCKFFVVVGENGGVNQSAYSTPATSYTQGTATSYGNTTNLNATTTTYGGTTGTISRPWNELMFHCYLERPADPATSFSAEFVSHKIRAKYALPDPSAPVPTPQEPAAPSK